MKRWGIRIAICVWGISATVACAQFEIDADLLYKKVLQYEPVWIKVQIQNNTSKPLHVAPSNTAARLVFDIESAPGRLVENMDLRVVEAFTIPAGASVVQKMDLLGLYDLRGTGPYTVRARLDWKNKSYISSTRYLDIVPGLELNRLITDGPGGVSLRCFSLRSLYRERRTHLFVRIEDKDNGICYGLYDLGKLLRVGKPEIGLNGDGNVEIRHQSAPEQFTRTTLSLDGKVIDQQVDGVFTERESSVNQNNIIPLR